MQGHRISPPALLAVAFGLVVSIVSAPAAHANLLNRHFKFDAMYAGTTYVSTIVTVVDPGVEIACATPTSNGPGCGVNINQGGYSIDFQDSGIVFRTAASFGSMYGPDRNLLRFTLVDGGFLVTGASLTGSDVPGLVASRVTFNSSSVTLDVSGLLAPAMETTTIAVSVSPLGPQMAPNPNPLGHTIDVLAALLNASAFDNLGEILIELSGSLLNSDTLTNHGTIDNFGSLIDAFGGVMDNIASLMNEAGSTLTNNGSLTNSGGGPAGSGDGVTNAGTVTNNGTVTNSGSFLNQFNAALNNIGNIMNSGNLDNRGGWFTSGTVTSSGTVFNEVRATLENAGMIMTGAGGAINAYFDNAGALINNGTIDNWGVLRNEITGALTNAMKIVNEADAQCQNLGNLMNDAINSVFENDGHVMNSGTFDVGPHGAVTGSGTYTQTGGTTVVNGTMSQTAVDVAGGVLQGVGAVSGSVTNEGGTVAPGNSPGTLTINGSYTQKAGSLKIWVAGTGGGQYSTLIVHGVADLSGGTLRLSFINRFVPRAGDQWQVLTASTLKNFDPASCRLDGLLQGSAISCRQSGNTVVATVTAVTGAGATYTVPIVLSSGGLSGSFFTSEMALTNRGTTDATITYVYTAAFGGSNGTATDSLAAGRQKLIPDVIAYLGDLGIPAGASGNRGGTLQVNFSGLSSTEAGAATVRTTTAVAEGRAGLAYGGLSSSRLLSAPVYLCGLRQNATDRSNVAVLNTGSPTEGEIRLRLRVVSGDPANPVSQVLPDIVLAPGAFHQESGILASNGLSLDNGYVRVERVSGTAPFYAYGVINDQANSDGSFVEPVLSGPASPITRMTLPVIVETPTFSSELVLTNFASGPRTLRLTYVSSALSGGSVTFSLPLLSNEQQILPAFVQFLRDRGVISGSPGPTFVGALFVTDATGDLRGVSVGARTSSAGGGGRYGLFYSAVPAGSEATTSAWLYGLQQNAENRTNLALVAVGSTDSLPDTFHIDLYDSATGQKAGSTDVTVPANGFSQINGILSTIAPSVASGYVLVTRTSGSNPFITYAVVNDGGLPGQRSGDGAFVSASVPVP